MTKYTSLTSKLAELDPERAQKVADIAKERAKEAGWKPQDDVFVLVMKACRCTFPEAVEIVAGWHKDEGVDDQYAPPRHRTQR